MRAFLFCSIILCFFLAGCDDQQAEQIPSPNQQTSKVQHSPKFSQESTSSFREKLSDGAKGISE